VGKPQRARRGLPTALGHRADSGQWAQRATSVVVAANPH